MKKENNDKKERNRSKIRFRQCKDNVSLVYAESIKATLLEKSDGG